MAIDPIKLSAPVKALLVDGALVELPEGGTWAGAWAFPPAWTEQQRDTWAEIQGNLTAEKRRLDGVHTALANHLQAPESMLAAARAEVDEAQKAREAAERLAQGVKALQKARETYGANLRHMNTVDGDIVIMVSMTLLEADAANARARHLHAQAIESDPKNFLRAEFEATGAHRDSMKAKIVWPPRERFEEITTSRPALWGDVAEMRNDMARARADAEGKGSAP